MGVSINQLGVIISLKEHIINKNVLSLGVQFPPLKNQITIFQKKFPELLSYSELDLLLQASFEDFQKVLFKNILGAKDIHSIDVSPAEGADYIWNMNEDMSIYNEDRSLVKLNSSFDFIFEGGTMEHVSNISSYLKNIFFLLKSKGLYCVNIPSNGYFEHGFFQFSPTFFADLTIGNFPNITLDYLCVEKGDQKIPGLAFDTWYKKTNFDFPPKLASRKSHRFYKNSFQSTTLATGTLIYLLGFSFELNVMAVIQKKQNFSLNMNLIQSVYADSSDRTMNKSDFSYKKKWPAYLKLFIRIFPLSSLIKYRLIIFILRVLGHRVPKKLS